MGFLAKFILSAILFKYGFIAIKYFLLHKNNEIRKSHLLTLADGFNKKLI